MNERNDKNKYLIYKTLEREEKEEIVKKLEREGIKVEIIEEVVRYEDETRTLYNIYVIDEDTQKAEQVVQQYFSEKRQKQDDIDEEVLQRIIEYLLGIT